MTMWVSDPTQDRPRGWYTVLWMWHHGRTDYTITAPCVSRFVQNYLVLLLCGKVMLCICYMLCYVYVMLRYDQGS